MSRIVRDRRCNASGRANAGSQRHIQFYVNEKPSLLNRAIDNAFDREFGLLWVSPLKNEHYQEYKDVEFLTALGMGKHGQQLRDFWPKSGPRWDALARVESLTMTSRIRGLADPQSRTCTTRLHPS
jgi:hypothetical protein